MKILVINSGSSSIKFQLFEMPEEKVLAKGLLEKIGEGSSCYSQKSLRGNFEIKNHIADHEEGIHFILKMLSDPERGVISSVEEITGIGHRVLHCGDVYNESVLADGSVEKVIEDYIDLGPLHNAANLIGIRACKKSLPHAVEVATFDTSFHSSMPAYAYLYAIPKELYRKYKIRKYGFHGTSHRYVSRRLASLLGRRPDEVNSIICHLGNGCSVCAVEKGRSVDTSMGLTPLEGLVMGTRSGDLDPAVLFYLGDKGYSLEDLNNLLNKKSGLLGLSEISNDMRTLAGAKDKGDKSAELAIEVFCYRLKKYIGSYIAALNGNVDAVVFTGGIGENNVFSRQESLKGLESLGIKIDPQKNETAVRGFEGLISAADSRTRVFVIPTNEELQIALDTLEITRRRTESV